MSAHDSAWRADTGPLFVKYNGVLRGLGDGDGVLKQRMERLCADNRYTTTLVPAGVQTEGVTYPHRPLLLIRSCVRSSPDST